MVFLTKRSQNKTYGPRAFFLCDRKFFRPQTVSSFFRPSPDTAVGGSSEISRNAPEQRNGLLALHFHRFLPAIEPALRAYAMEQDGSPAVGAGSQRRSDGFVVRSSLVTTGRRDLVFRMCHFSLSAYYCMLICLYPLSIRQVRRKGCPYRPQKRSASGRRTPIRSRSGTASTCRDCTP